MNRALVWICILLMGLTASVQSGQTISLKGKVSNKSGKPISNAIVKLLGQQLADTTDAQGVFSISGVTFVLNPAPILPKSEKISLVNGVILISLTKPAPVTLEMFDLKGNLLEKTFSTPNSAGEYRFAMTNHPFAANIMLIRLSIGQRISTFRYVPITMGKRMAVASISACSNGNEGLAKSLAVIDKLNVSASGYLSSEAGISSYQGTVNFTLDTLALDKFSFFVTSLRALRELSNNKNGFGGDLRFGKTGQGAGLLGADSICQCIAEQSMPGSKVKTWRAFLSAVKGPNGQQVNAIDRIGEGPWYDRIGRLVAQSKQDLLQNRPVGIDAAIKNDLPNEDGVPNHRPDPNKPAVDNHLTVTGSDSLGKLFSTNSTCQDWTTNIDTTSKPRSGLSWTRTGLWPDSLGGFGKRRIDAIGMGAGFWPDSMGNFQMMNMYSWVSSWSLPGCLAGVDSSERTGAGKRGDYTIGAGGGYGGFYCFALNP